MGKPCWVYLGLVAEGEIAGDYLEVRAYNDNSSASTFNVSGATQATFFNLG